MLIKLEGLQNGRVIGAAEFKNLCLDCKDCDGLCLAIVDMICVPDCILRGSAQRRD